MRVAAWDTLDRAPQGQSTGPILPICGSQKTVRSSRTPTITRRCLAHDCRSGCVAAEEAVCGLSDVQWGVPLQANPLGLHLRPLTPHDTAHECVLKEDWKTTLTQWRSTSSITISITILFASATRCGLRPQGPLASPRVFGRLVILCTCWKLGKPLGS